MACGLDWAALGGKTCARADARGTAIGARTSRAGRAAASGRSVRPGHSDAEAANPSQEAMMSTDTATTGILAEDNRVKREEILEMLATAYWMEVETVMSYLANSVNPDGVRAQEIIESLEQDIGEELGHAKQFANRIKELYGVVPGSLEFTPVQTYLQPPQHQTDIVHVIKGVIEAESGAIDHYNRIIEATDGVDWVTQDMVITILRDEERHRRLFEGYLREYRAEGLT
jgi:bacterioferritin